MIKWTRPSPSIFSKCKRSKAGWWESLGTRINNKYACAFVLVLKVIGTVCLYGCYECIPIKAHPAVATQHMLSGLSNTDYRIWENISHVALYMGNTIGAYTRYNIVASYPCRHSSWWEKGWNYCVTADVHVCTILLL